MELAFKNSQSRRTFPAFPKLLDYLLPFKAKRTISIKGERSAVLNTIYRSILSSESINDSIRKTIQTFKDHFDFTNVSITIYDFEKGVFTPYGFDELEKNLILKDGLCVPLGELSSLEHMKRHETYLVQDLHKKQLTTKLEKDMMKEVGIRSYFLCPLVGKGELIGSLNFASDYQEAFSEEIVQFCQEVANGIALSLHQHHLQEKIRTMNEILRKKEKSITHSIRYAKRIQQAKLPNEEQIRTCAPDSFVLFKPKDIVSGDFYFFHKNKGTTFIACADCTGHGVPGALMSMICSEKLTEAIMSNTDTTQILSQLNKKIKQTLQQNDH